jgi:hypothetical protein
MSSRPTAAPGLSSVFFVFVKQSTTTYPLSAKYLATDAIFNNPRL